MSRRPPPKHYVSSMSEDDGGDQQQQQQATNNNMPPPPPPPPPPAVLESDNNNNSPPPSLSLPPHSVLRINNNHNNNTSKSSVAFSDVMDNLNMTNDDNNNNNSSLPPPPPPPPPPPNDDDDDDDDDDANIIMPATAAANAITSVQQHQHHQQQQKKKKSSSSSASAAAAAAAAILTLDNVIQSQFENEAETHILAALEMEELDNNNDNNNNATLTSIIGGGTNNDTNTNNRMIDSYLLGESLEEGMEDYSEDEDDVVADDDNDDEDGDGKQQQQQQQKQPPNSNNNNRHRTWSNDSFLRKFKEQSHELPQYQVKLYPTTTTSNMSGDRSSASTTSPSSSPQVRRRKGSIGNQSSQSQQQHRQRTSSSGGLLLQSVPDDSSLEYDIDGDNNNLTTHHRAKTLAMHIESEHYSSENDRSDNPFLEGIKNIAAVNAADRVAAKVHGVQEDQIASDTREEEEEEEEAANDQEDVPTTTGDTINIKDQTSGEIDNMNFMTNRLRSLQQRRRSLIRSSLSTKRSFRRGSTNDNNGGDQQQQTSGDRLIDALNSVDYGRSNKSFVSRMKNEYNELIVPKYPKFRKNISNSLLFVILPCLCISSILFYMVDNPMAGDTGTSISWWILFLGVRQPLMFELTRVGEVFWVEILALRSKLFNLAVGPYVSLAFIQSQGWPYIICFWAVLDFVFLYGSYEFPKHWLWWQNKLDLFNAANPVVGVTDNETYMLLLISCIFVGVTSSLKRLFLAIYLGRREVAHYGPELEALMAKMILIGEVANLARDIEKKRALFEGSLSPIFERGDEDEKLVRFRELMYDETSSVEATPSPHGIQRKTLSSGGSNTSKPSPTDNPELSQGASPSLPHSDRNSPTRPRNSPPRPPGHSPPRPRGSSSDGTSAVGGDRKKFETSSKANVKLLYLLSEWEEPESAAKKSRATVRDLVEFKKAVASMDDRYPLSHAFGYAKTREECVQSSQEVYGRLMLSAGDCSALPFSIISVLAMDEKGEFVDTKIKALIRLFRPDRVGNLTRLDFVKSVDTVYKQLRLLRASIANSAQIDFAFERIVNLFFYFFLAIIAVAILGINIWTIVLSFNTFFLGFSFLFGSAASNYFEGLLLIFVRRPYDIGDRIATSNPKSDTNSNGSSTWYVDRVTLFTTTVRFATTNEVATYSNGSLALLRIINANRSPKAIISVLIKFGLETPFSKITVFRTAVENFIKARPREWIALVGFRATRVEADFGYIEYKIVVQHRESWQNIGPVLQSKADLSSFCLEATKKLDMKYESPPMPVNLSTSGNLDMSGIFEDEDGEPRGNIGGTGDGRVAPKSLSAEDLQEVANLFEIRKNKR